MYIPLWVIIVIGVLAFLYYRKESTKVVFVPFMLSIRPNWYELLQDYKVITDDSEKDFWKRIGEKLLADKSRYSALKNDLTFTVLKNDKNSTLIYRNDRHSFHTTVYFREELSEISITGEDVRFPFSPGFYVEGGLEGFGIGLRILKSEKRLGFRYDTEEVKVATIPYCVFRLPGYGLGMASEKETAARLKAHGWTKEQSSTKESLPGVAPTLKHKYFTVYCEHI